MIVAFVSVLYTLRAHRRLLSAAEHPQHFALVVQTQPLLERLGGGDQLVPSVEALLVGFEVVGAVGFSAGTTRLHRFALLSCTRAAFDFHLFMEKDVYQMKTAGETLAQTHKSCFVFSL